MAIKNFVLLIVFLFLASAFAQSNEMQMAPAASVNKSASQKINEREKNPKSQQIIINDKRGTKEIPFVVENLPVEIIYKKSEDDKKNEDEKSMLDRILSYSTLALVIVTAFLAGFTFRLWSATVNLVSGAEKTAERQLRAYVHIADMPIQLTIDNNKIITNCMVYIKWENAGVTPALDCAMWTNLGYFPFDRPFEIPFQKDESSPIKMALGPKCKIDSSPINIEAIKLINIFDKKARAFIWGYTEYRDIFSKEDAPIKHTEVCLEVIVEIDPRLAIDPTHPQSAFDFKEHENIIPAVKIRLSNPPPARGRGWCLV